MKSPTTITIRAIIFADEHAEVWIAQGLDFDICAQASTLEGVQRAFETAVMADAYRNIKEGRFPFDGIEPAPSKFWRMWDDAEKMLPLRGEQSIPLKGAPSVSLNERLLQAAL